MSKSSEQSGVQATAIISRSGLDQLLAALAGRGYKVIGPTVRDQAIVYEEIASTADLPEGWTDEQEGGTYRLRRREDGALFGFNVGPNSWKSHLFPATLKLWQSRRGEDGEITFEEEEREEADYAFIGVRSCDLAAIGVQDRVFIGNGYTDPDYEARRRDAFIVAVNCGQAGNTCFCVSMETGPKASSGFDLALTELLEGEHRFLVEVGSERGAELLAEIERGPPRRPTSRRPSRGQRALRLADGPRARDRRDQGAALPQHGAPALGRGRRPLPHLRQLHPGLPDLLLQHGRGRQRPRGRGGRAGAAAGTPASPSITPTSTAAASATRPKSRYRQWMTHKLATWIDQFGTSGCVGCGRCITWCPVAIDITEEAAAIRATDLGEEGRGIDAGD